MADLFSSLEFTQSRRRCFGMSLVVHSVLLTLALIVPLMFTEAIKLKYDTVLLAPPMPKKHIVEVTPYRPPKPKLRPPERPAPVPEKPKVVEPPKPKPPEPPKLAERKIPKVLEPPKPKPAPPPVAHVETPAPKPAPPKLEVRTGTFTTPAEPTTTLRRSEVQTGGFGDPNGVKAEGKPGKPANIASLGAFDLPAGPGAGNGTGGARGAKGVVASAGFGDGAEAGHGATNGNRSVQQGAFGDAKAAAPERDKKRADAGPPETPVEILFKPKPAYTDEARALKLEGEVLLRVLFTAGGEVRVLNVAHGMGHGLDENAIRAAQQIKFKPAEKDGRPVDSTANVRILFQLAY